VKALGKKSARLKRIAADQAADIVSPSRMRARSSEDAREAAGVLAKEFRADDDLKRPHMSLGYLTPAEFAPQALGPESMKALFRA